MIIMRDLKNIKDKIIPYSSNLKAFKRVFKAYLNQDVNIIIIYSINTLLNFVIQSNKRGINGGSEYQAYSCYH